MHYVLKLAIKRKNLDFHKVYLLLLILLYKKIFVRSEHDRSISTFFIRLSSLNDHLF